MNKARGAVVVSLVSLALPVLVAVPVEATQSGFSHVHNGKAPGVTVSPFESPEIAPSGHAPLPARLAPAGGTPSRATGSLGPRVANPRIQAPVNSTNEEQIFKAFPSYTHADAPPANPPDVSVATNGTQILSVNNFRLRVFSRAGGTPSIDVTTPTFFVQDSTFTVDDPQVVYDAATGRWFLSAMEINSGATGGKVLLMVSAASTLTNSTTWHRFVLTDTGSTLNDQPKLGLTSDKVLVAWETFASGTSLSGPVALVANKAQAVNFVASLSTSSSSGGTNDFGLAPANNLSPGTDGYFVESGNPGSTILTVLHVTGAPGTTNGTFFSPTQQTLSTPTASPPNADGGLCTACIRAGDTRIQNAVWRAGVLSFVAGQGCLPYGSSGSTPTDCARLWRVNTPSLSVAEDSTYGLNGGFVFDPAISYSNNGDLHLTATLTVNGFLAPSMLVVGRPAGSGSWGAFNFVTIEQSFDYVGLDTSPYRWGDFASVVPDPNNPSDVFAAGESTDGSTGSAPNFQVVVAHIGIPLDTVTLARSATAIAYGGSVKLTGTLKRPGGQAQAGEPLQLWRKLAPASSFTDYQNLTTTAAGTVTYTDHPTTNAQYEFIYPGKVVGPTDVTNEFTLTNQTPSVSEPVMVKVLGSANHTLIHHGSSVTLTFTVTPNEHGKVIYLQRLIGTRWRTVASHALNSASAWAFAQVLASIGTYKFRAYEAGDATHATGFSLVLTVKAT